MQFEEIADMSLSERNLRPLDSVDIGTKTKHHTATEQRTVDMIGLCGFQLAGFRG